MPKMVMTHAVVDVERWLGGKEARAAAIGAVGANVTDYVASDGSNNIASPPTSTTWTQRRR